MSISLAEELANSFRGKNGERFFPFDSSSTFTPIVEGFWCTAPITDKSSLNSISPEEECRTGLGEMFCRESYN